MASIQIRVSDEDKKAVDQILASLGLDMTTAVRMYLKRIVIENGIPFPAKRTLTINGFTPEFEAEVLRAAAEDERSPIFETAEEAIAFLHAQDPSKQRS